eukprot:jgi/Chrzof1/12274/Cz06g28090.t1
MASRHSSSSLSAGVEGSSNASDTSDARALEELQDRSANDQSIDDLVDEQNKTVEDTVFSSLHTLTKNKQTLSLRLVALRVLLDYLLLSNAQAQIHACKLALPKDIMIYKAIYWVLFRSLVVYSTTGDAYPTYIAVFYLLAAVILAHAVLTLWAAVMLKKDDNASVWVKGLCMWCSCLAQSYIKSYGCQSWTTWSSCGAASGLTLQPSQLIVTSQTRAVLQCHSWLTWWLLQSL